MLTLPAYLTPRNDERDFTICGFVQRNGNGHGFQVNHKRMARLMRLMGLQAVCPRPRTSVGNKQHKKYPYMLRGLAITRPNQVWCADITYVPMPTGFMYLVAIMDWFSRFVLVWQLPNTLDGAFLPDRSPGGLARSPTGYLQHRPGRSVHCPGLCRGPGGGPSAGQHRWPRPRL